MISHDILFAKLECYGVHVTALDWFKSYLSHRIIQTKCQLSTTGNTHYSGYYDMEIGTPQGSCLGPLLFLIFCNDLHFNLEFCNAILFTDDTTLYKSHRNLEYLKWCIIHDMTLLCNWSKANQLSLNGTKSVCMLFTKKQEKLNDLKVGKIKINFVNQTKFLGVWIDRKLDWKYHIDKVLTKVKPNLNPLRLGKHFLNVHVKQIIYFAQIQSHFTYGLSVWGNMILATAITQLQKLQNKCVNLIMGQGATLNKFAFLQILHIDDLIKLENCKFGYKLLNYTLPECIIALSQSDQYGKDLRKSHRYSIRHKKLLNKPKAQNKLYRSCIVYIGTESLNSLKLKTRNKPNLQLFVESSKKEFSDVYKNK